MCCATPTLGEGAAQLCKQYLRASVQIGHVAQDACQAVVKGGERIVPALLARGAAALAPSNDAGMDEAAAAATSTAGTPRAARKASISAPVKSAEVYTIVMRCSNFLHSAPSRDRFLLVETSGYDDSSQQYWKVLVWQSAYANT